MKRSGLTSAHIHRLAQMSGGLGDDADPSDFDQEQVEMGVEVEMEHTDDQAIAMDIVLDHLTESPDYYTKLDKMERQSQWRIPAGRKTAGRKYLAMYGYFYSMTERAYIEFLKKGATGGFPEGFDVENEGAKLLKRRPRGLYDDDFIEPLDWQEASDFRTQLEYQYPEVYQQLVDAGEIEVEEPYSYYQAEQENLLNLEKAVYPPLDE